MEFNNGFITAIALFLEHKSDIKYAPKDKNGKLVISDLRLYVASDHLYEMEIPKSIIRKAKICRFSIWLWKESWIGIYLKFCRANADILIPYKKVYCFYLKILNWRQECFIHRLDHFKDTKFADKLFEEAEDILAQIDEGVFQTKKVEINYR